MKVFVGGGGVLVHPPPQNFQIKKDGNGIFNILNKIITGLPVAQPSYKMGLVFPFGTNRTLVCSVRVQDIRVFCLVVRDVC